MSKQVVFTISNGDVKIEASGFKGVACDAATKAFEDVLGGPAKKKRTAEFYATPEVERIRVGAPK